MGTGGRAKIILRSEPVIARSRKSCFHDSALCTEKYTENLYFKPHTKACTNLGNGGNPFRPDPKPLSSRLARDSRAYNQHKLGKPHDLCLGALFIAKTSHKTNFTNFH